MDQKTIITTGVAAAVTLIVTLVVGSVAGVFARGTEALTEDQIKDVLKDVMVADFNGETLTYGQALSKIDSRLTSMEAALTVLTE